MKKLALYCLLAMLCASCGNETTTETTNTDTLIADSLAAEGPMTTATDPSQCGDFNLCEDDVCERHSANYHEITKPIYETAIKTYYGVGSVEEAPAPKIVSKGDMDALLATGTCSTHRLVFRIDEGDQNTHESITLTPTAGIPRPAGETNSYSYSLFRGIYLNHPSTANFHFSRGKTTKGLKTMMILAVDGQGAPVYYGDLSDTFPTPPDTLGTGGGRGGH